MAKQIQRSERLMPCFFGSHFIITVTKDVARLSSGYTLHVVRYFLCILASQIMVNWRFCITSFVIRIANDPISLLSPDSVAICGVNCGYLFLSLALSCCVVCIVLYKNSDVAFVFLPFCPGERAGTA